MTANEIRCPCFHNKVGKIDFVLTNFLNINSKHVCNERTVMQNVEFQSGRIDALDGIF